ncbi:MAG TPA: molybdopterin-dependent oxidoreductase [Conexibacter sp.]|nr:molybdopterin-dependent oxidoreductase [Conexibacter sp.]
MAEEKATYCRICEPLCGMVATVEDGRLLQLRPDADHPLSQGFACPKGIAFEQVHNDPDRVLHPLRRRAGGAPGEFEQVTWDEALADIVTRLRAIHDAHGPQAIGWYWGNPGAFSASHTLWLAGFMTLLGSSHLFTAGSQDVNSRFVASQLLYGGPLIVPIPDLARTDLLVVLGANPLVSHGSVLTSPRIKESLHGIVGRGGRVVVVDPRRTETARAFEWLPITPDGDAWLLLSLLNVLFEQGLADTRAIEQQASGVDALRTLAAPFTPEETEQHSGIPAAQVRELARTLASTERAALYGRTGTCLGRHSTLVSFLVDAVNVVAGNLDREGGAMFGTLGIPGERFAAQLAPKLVPVGYDNRRNRLGNFPEVLGSEPATLMAKEISTPGPDQIKALFVSAGNPVLSVPNGDELEAALPQLDLCVSLDLYVNETNAYADYVLPATTMYERADFPLPFQTYLTTPFRQATEAVVPPAGEAREEWETIDVLMRALARRSRGLGALQLVRRGLRLIGRRLEPQLLLDLVVRLAEGGDRLGLKPGGLTLKRLNEEHPHGKVLRPHLRGGVLGRVSLHRDRRVALDHPAIAEEVTDLRARAASGADDDFPLRLIGMRELRSENSWMHNAPLLLRGGRRQCARMHPEDAVALGIEEDATVRLATRHGAIELPVALTDDLKPGVVAVPHGWGHKGTGGWRKANAAARGGGVNVNLLMSSEPEDLERLAGMAILNGVPVRAEAVAQTAEAIAAEAPA